MVNISETMVKDCSLFSNCGRYFVHSSQNGKLKIWDTISGTLKQEYVPNLHLNSPCSSLTWIDVPSRVNSPWKSKKRKVEEDNNIIALGTTDGFVALFSLSEGKIVSKLEGGHSSAVTGLGWSQEVGLFSSSHHEVVVWDVSNKQVKSKWKSNKGKITCICVSDDGEFCVTGSHTLQLWDVKNKKLLKTYTGHHSEVVNLVFVNKQYFLSCGSEDRHITVWSTKDESNESLGRFALGESIKNSISIFENESTLHLCTCTRNGLLLYFNHQLNGKIGKVIKPLHSVEILEDHSSNILPVTGIKMSSESMVAVAYGHAPFFNFEIIDITSLKKRMITLTRKDNHLNKVMSNNKTVKDTNEQAEYVNYGNRRKQGDVAMEERLGNLSIGNPVISDKYSPYNLSNLLTQGLESKDRALLESVLFRKDPHVIAETVSKLPVSALPPLINQLNSMIQGRTFSSIVGCMWLKGVLRQHSSQLLANGNTSGLLASLQALIESRLAVLGPLRGLSGRLEHIISQLDSPQDQSPKNEDSVLFYQEEDSSDERESLMLDGEGSESEDKWEELSEDQLDTDEEVS
ncbi:WD repeat-containing protein 43 [Halyomorpha halys]|uniref:WD repeat-containing protein 43 n=1 Tax=Halyomorpha halys TaxID=286706 RepID=UPI0006D4EFFE|nr:WD repeat-containing protein 43 [Halyomorpha halys]